MTTPLRIDSLQLTDFRLFHSMQIDFQPDLTVLVADNAGGKTAILEAVGIATDSVTSVLWLNGSGKNIEVSDVRVGPDRESTKHLGILRAQGVVADIASSWHRSQRAGVSRVLNGKAGLKSVRENIRHLLDETGGTATTLPVVAFYGTERQRRDHAIQLDARHLGDRLSAYAEFGLYSASFQALSTWYQTQFEELGRSSTHAGARQYRPERLLAAVNKAVNCVLEPTGWRDLTWVSDPHVFQGRGSMVVSHPKYGAHPVARLSDGIRSMIGLVGDLAHRCARLNPHLGEDAATQTSGVLLVDEVDLHLHPSWQQQVVPLLRHAFPSMQMILTTHSPQVITSVTNTCIRTIEVRNGTGTARMPELQTRGVESADALARVMGVDPIPKVKESVWLSEYRGMIEQGQYDTEAARNLLDKLIIHFGIRHPVILDCDRLARFQRIKQRAPGLTPSL